MATMHSPDRGGAAPRAPRRLRAPTSLQHLDAYLLARETLRRLKPTPTPLAPRDPPAPAGADPGA